MPKGVDKAVAMKMDRQIRGLKLENCIGLGDSIEDQMARRCTHFLMKDAVERTVRHNGRNQ